MCMMETGNRSSSTCATFVLDPVDDTLAQNNVAQITLNITLMNIFSLYLYVIPNYMQSSAIQ